MAYQTEVEKTMEQARQAEDEKMIELEAKRLELAKKLERKE